MDEIHVVEHHYIKGGEGVSDKVNWRGKYEIKEYSLLKFKYIIYNKSMNISNFSINKELDRLNKFGYTRTFTDSYRKILESIKHDIYLDNFISNVNSKHPSAYRNTIKKLAK